MKSIVVASENTDAIQALHVNGELKVFEDTIYVSIIMEFVEAGEPITLRQQNVDLPENADWPETLEGLMDLQKQIAASPAEVWPKWTAPVGLMISGNHKKPIAYSRNDSEYRGETFHVDGSSFRFEYSDAVAGGWTECTEAEAMSQLKQSPNSQ